MEFLAHYIHNLDPVIFHLYGPIAVRWYGLAYAGGFIAAYFLLDHLIRRGKLLCPRKLLPDFIMWLALLGVLAGGRIGYVLFYDFGAFLRNPLILFEVWHGGMASHGGMLGVILVMIWYARKHGLSFWNLADNLACVVPVGIFFGRIANFINGELYGKVTGVAWAVIFKDAAGMPTDPRHPSQLYEAFGEGLVLFAALWVLRFTRVSDAPGRLSAFFLIGYGAIRIFVEIFREPDASLILGLSRGQFYSIFCVLAGAIILAVVGRKPSAQ
ncbi:prolipoprotein diacylglyceryl transferase [Kamptonema cortianum]|nr:prolipoprotein diacylglyceryl transferase [Oscillatoria laete-virens]MDK3160277.1 prolipoprotein diacylglyceryl transferase [Kamptonema cortianum]MDL5053662.1 prolipoprotein diacylglyceryl transferase [Oscillatoria laete-virens NRMC-F 0139]